VAKEKFQRSGPVARRGHARSTGTTDQRLLDSHSDTNWVHEDPWRVMRIQSEFVNGFGALAELGPAFSIFGSARTPEDHVEYKLAEQLARKLSDLNYAVITGGGPGIMEAANRGAYENGGESVGFTINLPIGQVTNKYLTSHIGFYYFFSRKVCMTYSAEAFVYFPLLSFSRKASSFWRK
jgi:hypothetical protein